MSITTIITILSVLPPVAKTPKKQADTHFAYTNKKQLGKEW